MLLKWREEDKSKPIKKTIIVTASYLTLKSKLIMFEKGVEIIEINMNAGRTKKKANLDRILPAEWSKNPKNRANTPKKMMPKNGIVSAKMSFISL